MIPSGFMQFVQSVPVAEVLATEGNIQVSITKTMTLHVVSHGNASSTALYFDRASSGSTHRAKKDLTASARR